MERGTRRAGRFFCKATWAKKSGHFSAFLFWGIPCLQFVELFISLFCQFYFNSTQIHNCKFTIIYAQYTRFCSFCRFSSKRSLIEFVPPEKLLHIGFIATNWFYWHLSRNSHSLVLCPNLLFLILVLGFELFHFFRHRPAGKLQCPFPQHHPIQIPPEALRLICDFLPEINSIISIPLHHTI